MNQKIATDQIRVVIFDCDGVLFDSREANITYYNTILKHFKKPCVTDEDAEIVHMSTAEQSVHYLFRDDPRLPEAQKFRLQIDYQQFIKLLVMEPNLEEVLGTLRNRYRLALATNRTNTIHTVLDVFNLTSYFDIVVSSLDVHKPKPHPEAVFKILDYFSVGTEAALYVGDSLIDYQVACQADIFFVAYKHPHLKADYHINDLRELLSILPLRAC